jgi:Tfp pilus assembly protein FimT
MICWSAGESRSAAMPKASRSEAGHTLVELLVVVAIMVTVAAMAVPLLTASMRDYQLRSAVTSLTGTVQATRYRAIAAGYQYQIVLNKAAGTYQVQNEVPPATTFSNVGGAVPLSGSSVAAVLGADTTIQFHPSGKVVCTAGTVDAAGNTTFTLTLRGKTETILVSRYGNINVTP